MNPRESSRRASLAAQFRWSLVATVVLSLLATGVALTVVSFRILERQQRELLHERSRAAAEVIDGYVEDLRRSLGYLARIRGLTELDQGTQQELLLALLGHNNAYGSLAILDRSGAITAQASLEDSARLDPANLGPALSMILEGDEFIGEVEFDPELREQALVMAMPVRDRRNRVAGALVARIDLRFLGFVVSEIQVQQTGYAYVVARRDKLIAEKGLTGKARPRQFTKVPTVLRQLRASGGRPPGAYRGLTGEEVLGALAPVHAPGWELVIELPIAEARQPLLKMARVLGITLALASALAAGVALVLSRRIVVPLGELTRAAVRISEGDLQARVKVSGQNELGILGAAFNQMTGDLSAKIAQARFLAEASEDLVRSLEPESVLQHVAEHAVPILGDRCWIVLEQGRRPQPRWISFPPELPPPPEIERLAGRILHSGEAPSVADTTWLALALASRGRVLGALCFECLQPGRYDYAQQGLAQEFARRIALALDNARLYRDAQSAVKDRELFLSIATHELRTPVGTLHLSLDSLLRAMRENPQRAMDGLPRRLEMLLAQTRRLSELLNQLLDVSRLTSGTLELQLEEVDLAELVKTVLARFAEELSARGYTLEVHSERAVGQWDRLRIEQVVTNLLSNAIKYGMGAPLEVRVGMTGQGARLEVRDHGVGVSPADQARIFERFQRAARDRAVQGLGLGLYITREIVAAHGGTIQVESAPGGGSRFIVELPPLRSPAGGDALAGHP